jgi:hypothetical protein
LKDSSEYEIGTVAALVPVYFRGKAYLGLGDGVNAAREFQRILDHRGTDPFAPVCALAQLGLGRALALQDRAADALAAYRVFFAWWSKADADLPILRDARAEAARLQARIDTQ